MRRSLVLPVVAMATLSACATGDQRDYNVAMGILVPAAVLTMLGNFLADIGYAMADPRVRLR